MSELKTCTYCGCELEEDDVYEFEGEYMCERCYDDNTCVCESCGDRMWTDDDCGDSYISLCEGCRNEYYTRCCCCNSIISNDDAYYAENDDYEEEAYCQTCYNKYPHSIHSYSYKPEPIFYGNGPRYIGVELEIDKGGKDNENADDIMDAVNIGDELIYIKSDGSLDDGLEIVTHPMTLDFHKNEMPWNSLSEKALSLDYLSHQTGTCGLHCHVNRNSFGEEKEKQDECISRVLYFVEHHWEELLKFSRRTESQMNKWAARYGFKSSPKEVMESAKKNTDIGRYACVNLTNYYTIEFRMFRGTLKDNTILATLELVDLICQMSLDKSDEEMSALSWTDFVSEISCEAYPELITYLKERQLYVNEPVECTEEM